MKIDIDQKDLEALKERAIKRAEDYLYDQYIKEINKEVKFSFSVKSIRNLAAQKVADKVVTRVNDRMDESGIIDRCLESAQKRMNAHVQDVLSKGITLKFDGGEYE